MPELADVRRRLAAVDAALAEAGRVQRAAEHREAIEQLRERFEQRFEALARAQDAAASLRRISSQAELLRQAPRALTDGTGFRRAIVSTIQESTLVPLAARFDSRADADADTDAAEQTLAQLREQPIRLEHHMVESDVMRRRRATLVTGVELNPRVDRRMATVLGWSAYVAAALLSGGSVIAMMHADRGPAAPLDALDRDVLWEFTTVLAQMNETAELRRALRQEREALRRFIDQATALSASLADAPITFSAYASGDRERSVVALPEPVESGDALRDDRLVFSGLLTARELDVLRLLAEGGTNHTIADALVLSDTTVKFHVNGILRKLHVANRAEAVARYLSMLGLPSPQ